MGPEKREMSEKKERQSIGQKREKNGKSRVGQSGTGERENMEIEEEHGGRKLGHCVSSLSGPDVELTRVTHTKNTTGYSEAQSVVGPHNTKPPDPPTNSILMDSTEVEAVFLSCNEDSRSETQLDGGQRGAPPCV